MGTMGQVEMMGANGDGASKGNGGESGDGGAGWND